MRLLTTIVLIMAGGAVAGQNAWKNIYSQPAWEARDKWQRADALIRFMKIGEGSRVADIGSHEGYMTFKLANVVGDSGVVYAVDLDEAKLEKVRDRAAQLKVNQVKAVRGDENDPHLPEGGLDAVLILDTYHEMDAHTGMLEHIKRALHADGRIVMCEPIADSRRGLSRSEQERMHELEMGFAARDLANAGFIIEFQQDNFIDRTAEKGDRMWVIVASRR